MVTTFADTPCVDPSLLYRDCRDRGLPVDWLGKANVFRVPAGRGPGTGGILLTREQLDSIDSGSSHQLKFEGETGDTVILRDITLTGSTCIWPSSESTLSAVYLCTLADRRHFLARSGAVGKAYNLRDRRGEYLTATTNGGTPWTWSGLWGQLWLPSEGTAPTLPFTPNGTPENFVYYDVGRWEAVNDFMDRLACQLVFDPRSGAFSVVRLGSADPATDTSLKAIHGVRTWDTYPSEPTRAWCPETIQVLFKRLPEPTDGSNPFYAVDIGLSGVSGTESGTVVILHDDLTAKGATGTPTNAGDLTSRANERATDWHRRRRPDRSRLLQVYHDGRMDGFEALHSVATEVAIGERGAGVSTETKASPDDALETWPKYDWRQGEGEGEEWPMLARASEDSIYPGWLTWTERIVDGGAEIAGPRSSVFSIPAIIEPRWEKEELDSTYNVTTGTPAMVWPGDGGNFFIPLDRWKVGRHPDEFYQYTDSLICRPVGPGGAGYGDLTGIAKKTFLEVGLFESGAISGSAWVFAGKIRGGIGTISPTFTSYGTPANDPAWFNAITTEYGEYYPFERSPVAVPHPEDPTEFTLPKSPVGPALKWAKGGSRSGWLVRQDIHSNGKIVGSEYKMTGDPSWPTDPVQYHFKSDPWDGHKNSAGTTPELDDWGKVAISAPLRIVRVEADEFGMVAGQMTADIIFDFGYQYLILVNTDEDCVVQLPSAANQGNDQEGACYGTWTIYNQSDKTVRIIDSTHSPVSGFVGQSQGDALGVELKKPNSWVTLWPCANRSSFSTPDPIWYVVAEGPIPTATSLAPEMSTEFNIVPGTF